MTEHLFFMVVKVPSQSAQGRITGTDPQGQPMLLPMDEQPIVKWLKEQTSPRGTAIIYPQSQDIFTGRKPGDPWGNIPLWLGFHTVWFDEGGFEFDLPVAVKGELFPGNGVVFGLAKWEHKDLLINRIDVTEDDVIGSITAYLDSALSPVLLW